MRTSATGLLASPGVAPLLRHHFYSPHPHRGDGRTVVVSLLSLPSQRRVSSADIPLGSGLLFYEREPKIRRRLVHLPGDHFLSCPGAWKSRDTTGPNWPYVSLFWPQFKHMLSERSFDVDTGARRDGRKRTQQPYPPARHPPATDPSDPCELLVASCHKSGEWGFKPAAKPRALNAP